jgi:ribonuclease P protein component
MGKSYAHPFVVLVVLSNDQGISRIAVSAGRSVGNAVQRNRAKRLLREAIRLHLHEISPGWDIILLARQPLLQASCQQTQSAIIPLLRRAHLMKESHDG